MRSYLVRRALRIVPLYWVALVVTYLFTGWESVHGVSGFLENAFFLQVYSRHWVFHGITQAWSLCIEVTFYLALPVWAAAMRGWTAAAGGPHDPAAVLRRELLALAALYVASLLFRLVGRGRTDGSDRRPPAAGCRRWSDHFALGHGAGGHGRVRRRRPARCRKCCAG